MKKVLILSLIFLLCSAIEAKELKQIEYENIKNNKKITIINNNWTMNVPRKDKNYFVKKTPSEITTYSNFYNSDDEFKFSTGTDYEFINKGQLIGYSNNDLKFYEYEYVNESLYQRELTEGEVQDLFPEYKVFKISDFSDTTNSLKIKKGKKDLKIILLNDTDASYYNYWFFTNNAEFEPYELKGFLNITKKGLIQFSRNDDNYERNAWYVLLIR